VGKGVKIMQSLALKYRPITFNEVVGQDNQINILEYQIKSGNIRNAYLFTGPAGTGKTTCARIFANEINKGKSDLTELDAAKNNGVDDVREIIKMAGHRPYIGKYKIFLLDEVHMFSQGAWDALLKILEEPPATTIFILCTTDPQKIKQTILSRVQRYDFKKITFNNIVARLTEIIAWENEEKSEGGRCDVDYYEVSEEAIDYIAKMAEGGMRSAISMLDKCLALNKSIEEEDVVKLLGVVNYDILFSFLKFIHEEETKELVSLIETIYNDGSDMKLFLKQIVLFLIDICKYKETKNFLYIKIPQIYQDKLDNLDYEICYNNLETLLEMYSDLKYETDVKEIFLGKVILLCQS
jgi:DNA polymerase III subunit gamma/tau